MLRFLARLRILEAIAILIASIPLVACPTTKTDAAPPSTCTKLGETCTFAPGKLGLCVSPADGGAELLCQSQH